jgi:hypothetical protein
LDGVDQQLVLEIEKTLGISLLCCYYYYTGGVVGVLVPHSIWVYVVVTMLVNQYRDRVHIWYEEEGNLKLQNTPIIQLNVGKCLLA